ncbi:MAG: hypothetical protein MPK06_04190 [Alphaproteobacteria bacterium]|nr:hypothetical protein [Alphaproteobacteria bacterium]MDA8005721.1 hypothetical protein [Alphaproteobacteria bacterium]MDA8010311.1 hypothetical protein [Alphaproteobacteria bacterium]MDA8013884.1 hypothetical protein [Alphaproteobacteria bacterium]MDA8031766.1 hypothetical protein [Alphaproteobacteria bacterium]
MMRDDDEYDYEYDGDDDRLLVKIPITIVAPKLRLTLRSWSGSFPVPLTSLRAPSFVVTVAAATLMVPDTDMKVTKRWSEGGGGGGSD